MRKNNLLRMLLHFVQNILFYNKQTDILLSYIFSGGFGPVSPLFIKEVTKIHFDIEQKKLLRRTV